MIHGSYVNIAAASNLFRSGTLRRRVRGSSAEEILSRSSTLRLEAISVWMAVTMPRKILSASFGNTEEPTISKKTTQTASLKLKLTVKKRKGDFCDGKTPRKTKEQLIS